LRQAGREFPKFRVELRNGGQHDLLLNLGIMNRNGGHQYPNAISLILEDAQGQPQRLELKKSFQVSDAGKAGLFLPLPVGATFSFPVDLDNYWAPTSKEFDSRLNSGTYWLAAQFTGSIGTDNHVIFIAGGPNQPANMVSLEPGLGATTPISNTLQFEIPSR
jgi:hypothetical protein